MSADAPGEVTRILRSRNDGACDVVSELAPLVYDELRRVAGRQMAGERRDHTLQPTALAHEALLRLLGRENTDWEDRTAFFRSAATVMRHILVNHARDRRRLKRGGHGAKVPLDDVVAAYEERSLDLLALDEALEQLAGINPRQAELVVLRFFGGLGVGESADVLGISERSAKTDWGQARQWLWNRLSA